MSPLREQRVTIEDHPMLPHRAHAPERNGRDLALGQQVAAEPGDPILVRIGPLDAHGLAE